MPYEEKLFADGVEPKTSRWWDILASAAPPPSPPTPMQNQHQYLHQCQHYCNNDTNSTTDLEIPKRLMPIFFSVQQWNLTNLLKKFNTCTPIGNKKKRKLELCEVLAMLRSPIFCERKKERQRTTRHLPELKERD